jgi:protein O-GlcNAc transferase
MILVNVRRYRIALGAVVLTCLLIGLTSYHGQVLGSSDSWPKWTTPQHESEPKPTTQPTTKTKPKPSKTKAPSLPVVTPGLPQDYDHEDTGSEWCEDRYGTAYLEKFRASEVSYCTPQSASDLHCFWSDTTGDRLDSMCYARGAVFDAEQKRWRMNCSLRPISNEEFENGVRPVPEYLTRYWYETGPGNIVENYITLDGGYKKSKLNTTTILVKREGSANPWHCMMEIMSLTYTLDILQISVDPHTNEPFITAKDGDSVQVVILDGEGDGPYFDLWKLFAKMPVRRIKDLNSNEPATNLILPLGGGSNPLWQGDWKPNDCRDAPLIKTFSRRVLAHYGIKKPQHTDDVVVTFIKRTNTRSLRNETELLSAARAAIPKMVINEVDFATMSFKDQLETVQKTDLLAGVHGAGLTHTMFLPRGSATFEILPHKFFHKGFRNLAQMMGNGYFSTHAVVPKGVKSDDWQMSAVAIDESKFVEGLREAVRSLYNTGTRSQDAV